MSPQAKSGGAIALVASGIAASAALAACCALPILLAGVGLSAYWLQPVAAAVGPFGDILTGLAVLALAGSVVVVVRAGRTCEPGDLCVRPAFRWSIIAAAILGAVLLVVSKIYA
jgi:mercuric ion transport protein